MGRVKRNQKRLRGLWQHGNLIAALFLCFFFLSGNTPKQASKPGSNKAVARANNKGAASNKAAVRANNKGAASKEASAQNSKIKKTSGYRVPFVKKSTFFHKARLRKGDIIHSVSGQPVRSKKDISKAVLKFSKKEDKFSMLITRNKKQFMVSYRAQKFKRRKKLLIADVAQIKPRGKGNSNKERFPSKQQGRGIASAERLQPDTKQKKHTEKLQSEKTSGTNKGLKSQPEKTKKTSGTGKSLKPQPEKTKKTSGTGKSLKPQPEKTKKNGERKITKKGQKTKRTLVPKKYKSHLQRAYVTSLNSFIYKKPNFDAEKLFSMEVGKKALISRKIFRPSHKFGSFHKIFLFQPKKIIGFISEAEVTPEFVNEEGKFLPNPKYQLAKRQLKKDKALDISLFEKKIRRKQKKKTAFKRKKRYYAGFSMGFSDFPVSVYEALFGLRLSGYGLLISTVNMDFNLMASLYEPHLLRFDVSASYPLIAGDYIHLTGGLKFDVNNRTEPPDKQNDFGFTGGASLSIPLAERIVFRLDARGEYTFARRAFSPFFLGSLQAAF